MRKILSTLSILAALSMLLGGCGLLSPQAPASTSTLAPAGPQTWIDTPLNHAALPLQTHEIVFHGSDGVGVVQALVTVNGQPLATLANNDPTQTLVTFRTVWQPPQPGDYHLEARTQGLSGQWSEVAAVDVVISAPTGTATLVPPPTGTAAPLPTETPTPSATVTFTPTVTGTPGLVFLPGVTADEIFNGSCGENDLELMVQVQPAASVTSVVVFTRLETSGGDSKGWDAGHAMNPLGDGKFQETLKAGTMPGASDYNTALVQVQFVATGSGGTILGRSQVYSVSTLTRCGTPPLIPHITLIPIITPFFPSP